MISGKINKITSITKDITNVVLSKSRNKKNYNVAILFYYHMSDIINKHYQESDFVKIWFRIRSNCRQLPDGSERYYTDIIGEKIVLVRRDGVEIVAMENDFGPIKNKYVFKETGELVEQHTLKKAIEENPDRE
tara:strand:+ start:98 stop:496 length:399 start_codon:yes stop_codon:yes gene_type:complete